MKLHEPTFGYDEISSAMAVMESTNVTQGNIVASFEDAFRPGSVACNSGSSANLLAISSLVATGKLSPGARVIVPALCWSTTVWPIIQCGLVPVIVDIDPDTLNIDVHQAAQVAASGAKAIMPVHVYGNPCDMATIKQVCEDYDLWLIEDCCEAMGAELPDGSPIGSTADIATFSTYFSHHITTFEGGIAHTDNPILRDMMRIKRSHGWVRDCGDPDRWVKGYEHIDPKFVFVETGYNLRLTEVAAAIGLVQLPKLRGIVARRREAWSALHHAFMTTDHQPWLRFQAEKHGQSSCFGFTIVVTETSPYSAGVLRNHFEANGIETRPIICGNIAAQPGLKKYAHRVAGPMVNADEVMNSGFSIGCHQGVTEGDAEYIASVMAELELPERVSA